MYQILLTIGIRQNLGVYHEFVTGGGRLVWILGFWGAVATAQSYAPPAGLRPVRVGRSVSILPGGRVIAPLGEQHPSGGMPAALELSPSGKTLVLNSRNPDHPVFSVLERDAHWVTRELLLDGGSAGGPALEVVSGGLALRDDHSAFASQGNSGRIALIDLSSGETRRTIDLNPSKSHRVFAGSLALDGVGHLLYVADPPQLRVAVVDTRTRQVVASLSLGESPSILTLSPDGKKLYAAAHSTGVTGALGGDQDSVFVINVTKPESAKIETRIPAGPVAGLVATTTRVFVSDAREDVVTVINAATNRVEGEVPIRVPGLELLRGVQPMGLAYDESTGWLLIAEAGLNAVGVVDTHSLRVVGHLPVGWFPTHVRVDRGTVYVANARGPGTGRSSGIHPGLNASVSIFPLPAESALAGQTEFVLQAAGLEPGLAAVTPVPKGIRHVVLIVKGNRSFDEILGDITRASNGPVMAAPELARYGGDGYVDGRRRLLSLHHLDVTPNHHRIAAQWTLSDNFYAESKDGEGLLAPEVFSHLAQSRISVYQFGEDFNPEMRDSDRVARLVREIKQRFGGPGADLPQLVVIRLPNDRLAPARPEAGFPYDESYLVDNDWALGRVMEYLSGTIWWPSMAVFVTEQPAGDGADHLDAHRTILFCAGPWAKRHFVSHTNTSVAGLWKTIFRLFGVPPLRLLDASAADLSDCLASDPDPAPYRAVAVDRRVFDPFSGGAP